MDSEDRLLYAAFERAFKQYSYVFKDKSALHACVHLAQEFGVSAEKIAFVFELLSSTRDGTSNAVTAAQIESKALRDELVRQCSNKAQPRTATKRASLSEREQQQLQPTPKRQATPAAGTPGAGLKTSLAASTPARTAHQLTPNGRPTPATTSKYASRTNSRQVASVLNDSVPPLSQSANAGGAACSIQTLGQQMPPVGKHLYMVEPLEAKVHAMDERISDWCDALKAALPNGEADNVNKLSVGDAAQDPMWVVGRVILEGGGEGEQQVLLEGGLEGSEGERVRLDLSALTSTTQGPPCRVFPGQIVAVHGTNPTGECILARQLCTHLPAPAPAAACDQACSMVVAAGPFTPGDELTFAPLEDLLQYCSDKQPDVVVLLGPFVDALHPAVESGNISATFEEVFQEKVLRPLAAWGARHPHARIALLPSTHDAHHAPVFPTPSFVLPPSLKAAVAATEAAGRSAAPTPTQQAERVQGGAGISPAPGPQGQLLTCLQNPCTFAAGGGLVAGACSSDVLKALAGSEQAKGGGPGQDRLGALTSHVLGQRSFFPVYPAPLGTCLDLSAASYLSPACTPHLLLLASDLAPFAKMVSPQPPQPCSQQEQPPQLQSTPQPLRSPAQQQSSEQQQQQQQQQPAQQPFIDSAPAQVVCVNPGRLAKGGTGGTFAHVHVQSGQAPVPERCRVEIVRI